MTTKIFHGTTAFCTQLQLQLHHLFAAGAEVALPSNFTFIIVQKHHISHCLSQNYTSSTHIALSVATILPTTRRSKSSVYLVERVSSRGENIKPTNSTKLDTTMNDPIPTAQGMPIIPSRDTGSKKPRSVFRRIQQSFLQPRNKTKKQEQHKYSSSPPLRSASDYLASLEAREQGRFKSRDSDDFESSLSFNAFLSSKADLEGTSTVVTQSTSGSTSYFSEYIPEEDCATTASSVKSVRFTPESPQVCHTSAPRITSRPSDKEIREHLWYSALQVQDMDNQGQASLGLARQRRPDLSQDLWQLHRECQQEEESDPSQIVSHCLDLLSMDGDFTLRGMERHAHPNMRKHRHYHTQSLLQLQDQLHHAKVSLSQNNQNDFLRGKSLSTSQTSRTLARVLALADAKVAQEQEEQRLRNIN